MARLRLRVPGAAAALLLAGCLFSADVPFTLTQPEDGEITSFNSAVVAGKVPTGSFLILVNGKEIRPNVTGAFQTTVPLKLGKNKITVEVGDVFRRTRKTVTVRRVKGVGDD